jgi:Utp11 protein
VSEWGRGGEGPACTALAGGPICARFNSRPPSHFHPPPPNSAARRKLGLLEKKSDYKARAADFQRKRATLASLRRKAEQRNPDEFYFAMEKQRTKGGVHVTE